MLVPLRNRNKQASVRKIECSEMQPDHGQRLDGAPA